MDRKSSFQNTKRSDERTYRYNYDSKRDYRPRRNSSPFRKQHNAVSSFSSYVPDKYTKKSEERDYRPTLRPRKRSESSESNRYHRPNRQEFNRHNSFKHEIQRKERTACLLVISRIREETLKKLIEIIPGLTDFKCVLDTSKKREYHVEFANEFLTAYAFSKLNGILLDGCGRIDMEYLPRRDEERFQTKENANIGAEIAKEMISRHPKLYMDNKPPRSAKDNGGLAMSRPNHSTNDPSFSRPSSLIYVEQNKPIASEQSYDRKHHEIKPSVAFHSSIKSDQILQDGKTDQKTKEKEPIIKDIKLVVIEMRSRDEINESLLSRIMAQFNNLVEAKLDDDRKSSRAVFSSDFDALLAVNCLNGAIIANTIFTARLVADTAQLIPKTAGAEINCVTNRSVNEDKVNQLSDSEIYLKEANYEYDDTSYETEDEQSSEEEQEEQEEEEENDDDDNEESDDLEYEWVSNKEDDSEESDVSEKEELNENNGNNQNISRDEQDKGVNQERNEPEIKVKRKSIDIDIDSIKTPKQVAESGIEISRRKKIKTDD